MTRKAPGKAHRDGITFMELSDLFPDEDSAREWFEARIWKDGRHCPRCGSTETIESATSAPLPYWCPACRRHFSVRIGTVMESSPLPLRKWVWAIYLHLTSLKGVSSMKLHRDIGVTQKTAWFMLQRIRAAFESEEAPFGGPIEVDETYMGGRERNKHGKDKVRAGRGAVGKTAVVGAKDRKTKKVKAKVVKTADKPTLHAFVHGAAAVGATVYTDEAAAYEGIGDMFNRIKHEAVKHSVGEYVRGQAHTNGMESFWSMLKRGFQGTYHKMSPKHLDRYVVEFAGRHGMRESDTLDQMNCLAAGMVGKRLTYRALITDNGLPSGARS